MKKNILLVGANGYIAKEFIQTYDQNLYDLFKVYRKPLSGDNLFVDFNDVKSIEDFELPGNLKIDVVLFMQGMNPSKNLKESDYSHFSKMLQINIIGSSMFFKKIVSKLNDNALILFLSSIASDKGSYDPSYAASKSALKGLMYSLANAYPSYRFNILKLGLVMDSPVYKNMTADFRQKHASKMFKGSLVEPQNVISVINEIITNSNISRSIIPLDGGYLS